MHASMHGCGVRMAGQGWRFDGFSNVVVITMQTGRISICEISRKKIMRKINRTNLVFR